MPVRLRLLSSAAVLVLLAGCAGLSNVGRADTLGEGNGELTLEPGLWVLKNATARGVLGMPHLDLSMHYGLTDRIDIGARTGSSLLELHGKFLLTAPGHERLAVSLAPTLGGLAAGSPVVALVNLDVPVLVGLKFGANELVLGPRAHNWIGLGDGSRGGLLAPGLSVGFAWQITENLGILPEVAVVVPALAWGGASMESFNSLMGNNGAPIYSAKLGVFFGRNRTAPAKHPQGPAQPAVPSNR